MKAKVKKRASVKVNKSRPEAIHIEKPVNSQGIPRVIDTQSGVTAYKLEILKVVTNLQVELACAIDQLRAAASPLREQPPEPNQAKS